MDAQTEVRIIISTTDATLGMGGWLSLTQSGLSPDKKCQAYSWRTKARDFLTFPEWNIKTSAYATIHI
jgi:hypothetical protein